MLSRHLTKRLSTRSDRQPRKKHTEEQGSNKENVNGKQNCFITLKNHKLNSQNNPTVRLLNSPKMNPVELVKPS